MIQNNVDIAFVQEPYTSHNNVAGFPKEFTMYAHGMGRKGAAIVINNKDIDIITIA